MGRPAQARRCHRQLAVASLPARRQADGYGTASGKNKPAVFRLLVGGPIRMAYSVGMQHRYESAKSAASSYHAKRLHPGIAKSGKRTERRDLPVRLAGLPAVAQNVHLDPQLALLLTHDAGRAMSHPAADGIPHFGCGGSAFTMGARVIRGLQ